MSGWRCCAYLVIPVYQYAQLFHLLVLLWCQHIPNLLRQIPGVEYHASSADLSWLQWLRMQMQCPFSLGWMHNLRDQ